MPSKSVFKSWTFWFNVAMGAYEVFANLGGVDAIPPQARAIVLLIGNLLLRLKTTQAVHIV